MRERDGHSLQPTALVHEAFLRLAGSSRTSWEDRAHFFGSASRAMRQVLVDHARRRAAGKRGGAPRKTTLQDFHAITGADNVDLIDFDRVLTRLQGLDERMARVVELRVFTGLKMQEIADLLGFSLRTIAGDWSVAKKWLRQELASGSR